MPTAFPLRVLPDGSLAQQDHFDAVIEVMKFVALTGKTALPHAPWFGLFEAFTEAGQRQNQDHENLKDSLNTALGKLGVKSVQVKSVSTGGMDPRTGRRSFRVTMEDEHGVVRHGDVQAA